MSFEIVVVTPEGQAFEGQVESAVLPGVEGEFGVLEGHEVFITALQPGPMEVTQDGQTFYAVAGSGFAEVLEDRVSVMISSVEFARDIDRDDAEVARERAKRQLEEMRESGEDEEALREYQEEYSKAVARVAVSEKFKA
jgi:F-type H+-transporting ATPase subunit epsilon